MDEIHLMVEVAEGIGSITLNRPEALNALSPEMRNGLIEATGQLERDPTVRCVVLRGNGKAFMAGGDVKLMHRSLTEEREVHLGGFEQRVLQTHQIIHQLRRMEKPVFAAVHGAIAGVGLGLCLAADLVLARSDAYLMMAYRHIGLTADGGTTYFLPRIVGERRALEFAMLGERVPAEKAAEIGLFNWVVDESEFESCIQDISRRLADGPTKALGRVKTLIRSSLQSTWDEQSHREAESIGFSASTTDHLEGVTAFVEKRKAVFRGA